MQDWQERWEEFNRDSRAASEKTQVERARIEQLEHQLMRLAAQRERLQGELSQLTTAEVDARLATLQAEQEQIRASGESAANQLREPPKKCRGCASVSVELVAADDRGRQQLQDEQGRLMSLQALQQAALGLAQGKVTEWLSSNSLAERPRLAQQLVVEPGWERAVETVLGSYLEAVSVDTIDAIANRLESLQVGAVSFFSSGGASAQMVDGGRLLARVQGPAAISALLTGIIAVDTLPEALDKRRTLLSGESVITRDGVWIGREWLRVSRDKDVHAGVIEPREEMRSLRDVVADGERQRNEIADAAYRVARETCRARADARDALQEEVNRLHRVAGDSNAQVGALRTKSEQTAERVSRIGAEPRSWSAIIAAAPAPLRKRAHACRKASRRWRSSRPRASSWSRSVKSCAQNLSFKRSQAQTRSRRRAGSRDQGRVEALGADSSISAGLERLRRSARTTEAAARRVDAPAGGRRSAVADTRDHAGRSASSSASKWSRSSTAARTSSKTQKGGCARSIKAGSMRRRGRCRRAPASKTYAWRRRSSSVRRETLLEQFEATQFELATV